MNLAALMNDGEDDGKKKESPGSQRNSQHFTPLAANGQPPTPYAPPPGQQTPLYPPPSLGRSSGSQGLAPLQTPSHASSGGQYPFPPSAGPPASASAGQYRARDPYSATPPGARPPSHTFQRPYASPSQPQTVGLPHVHQPNSVSPTPSSHRSQHTPHSVRQSPLAVNHQLPPGAHPHYQHSQPSTPLGPPPLHHQRSVGSHPELASPYRQRTYSNTSNPVLSANSPAIVNLVESPNALHRPSPLHQRRTSEYLSQIDRERERSVSVSPKTKVPPRPPSLGSRNSSFQDFHRGSNSSRSSGQQTIAVQTHSAIPQGQVIQPPYHSGHGAETHPLHHLNSATEVARDVSLAYTPTAAMKAQHATMNSNVAGHHSFSSATPSQPPLPNLNGAIQQDGQTAPTSLGQPTAPAEGEFMASSEVTGEAIPPTNLLKRPAPAADDMPSSEPPSKRKMTRKYTHPPPWAILSRQNPHYHEQQEAFKDLPAALVANGAGSRKRPHADSQMPQQLNQPNGNGNHVDRSIKPWQQNPPLDFDLIDASNVLGKWEKTFRWNTPYPDMLRTVQDWLYSQLNALSDVGWDAREGAIEIEARVGVLLQQGSDTERCNLPVASSTVINPSVNNRYHFKSAMSIHEHKAMNDFLNTTIQESCQPGRVRMMYKHLYETDSFHQLSPLGLSALPESLRRRHPEHARPPRLRVSRDSKTGAVLGRIVKMHISDLHIYNPNHVYDCRISINLEVNLDRPDLHPDSLIASPGAAAGGPTVNEPDRKKDRLSYKHLAYSIDLTKVESAADVTYELEVEVDAGVLRQQLRNMVEGKEHAFGDVVSGLLDNVTFLMRQRTAAQ